MSLVSSTDVRSDNSPGHAPPRRGRLPYLGARILAAVRRIPRAGRICFLIALVNSAVWGVVVPPWQVPDEISHFGYAQYLAETGKAPPQAPVAPYSPQEQTALDNSFFLTVIGHEQMRGILTKSDNEALRAALAKSPSPVGLGGATPATNQPPLYFALEAIPYWLSPSQDILARLTFMRLMSALMAACTVLVVFMFMRELFPNTPWTWTVGALVVAFQPMFDFMSAGVNADNMLYLTSALIFYLLLRTYRRGLTQRRAVAIGAATAAGLLGKLTFIALLPGIVLAVLLLGWRAFPQGRRRSLQMVATTVIVAAIPVLTYVVLNVTVWHRGSPLAGGLAGATGGTAGGHPVTLNESLDYIWELYLPRLPFMHHVFEYSHPPIFALWWNGTIGHFGWLDYEFPAWVYTVGRYLLYALLVLAVAGLVRLRRSIRLVLPIFACFGVMAVGLLGSIGYAGVRYYLSTGFPFEQARYLFPLLVFYALLIVLAARGTGRRWGPMLGAALVLLAMTHGLFAETLTISRYYG
jgi:Predicted membrane protein (DUF2142)